MNFNDRIKVLKRDLARNGMYASSWLINRLPYSAVKWITHVFIAIGFQFTIRQRQIARESLQLAFGKEKSPDEIKVIIRSCFENFGQGMIELIYFMSHPQLIQQKVVIEGKEHLDRAFQEGKGVIAVSAHFGNFPLMLIRFAQDGRKTNAIIRPTRDKKIEKYFFDERSRLGVHTIYSHPRKACVDETIKALRQNELVFIPLDQNFGSDAKVFVEFFGHKAATATGPVIFAKRTGAPILPMFIIREKGDVQRIIIEPPMPLIQKDNDQDMIHANVSQITRIIEDYIRRYPHEWGWMHRRWKSRPDDQQKEEARVSG